MIISIYHKFSDILVFDRGYLQKLLQLPPTTYCIPADLTQGHI